MKPIIVFMLVIFLFSLSGCAVSRLATIAGGNIGISYNKSMVKGIPSSEEIHRAWPFVSGLIKGLFGEELELRTSPLLRNTLTLLDGLAAKPIESLTIEEKGLIVSTVTRLEYLAGKEFYDTYGAGILGVIKALVS